MLDKHDHARGWLLKGDSDLQTVRTLLDSDGPFDTACFHAHQAVEKYLKALLAFAEQPIPRTHNLEDLEQICVANTAGWQSVGVDLTELTSYAVHARYDFDFWPDRDTTERALEVAVSVRIATLAALPPRTHP